ncbi:H-NS histone family protein [Bradyrhizobium sp. CB3481]|nr:H-NS histone family protein [Bradyrhizobium sp. CB3481]WFU20440.1 H-NS histone family protein [Bradyrhizobium sp. CB3481]
MSLDDLWDLHQRIIPILDRKLEAERRKLQEQLDELSRRSSGGSSDSRRPYPPVVPRFRNPDNPAETWSGRGKLPRWLATLIASGRNRDEFRI